MKDIIKWLVFGLCIIIAVGIHACADRYTFSHYQGTTTVYDHWTGDVTTR